MRQNQPIGFFDSGWGGLSIMKTARQILPSEDFIYVADCANAPYGDRTHEFIVDRARKIARFLFESQEIKALVIACNTATAEAIDTLRKELPQAPIVGVEPAIKPAVALSKKHCIGMISTTRTASSDRYRQLLKRYGQNSHILSTGCPGLMDCVEAGEFNTATTRELLHRYLDPMLEAGIDTLVLGCTHYPFLSDTIASIVGPEVTLYEPSLAVSRRLQTLLKDAQALRENHTGKECFYVSGLNEQRKSVACRLWGNATLFENLAV